jgi:hypothetical protein
LLWGCAKPDVSKRFDSMLICRNIASKKIFIFLEEDKNNRAYFISHEGEIKLFDRSEFEEFIEETNVMYLKEYLVITEEQYRSYLKHTQ